MPASYVLNQLVKTIAAIATPERVSATSKKFRTAIFIGNKAARTANTGDVWIGPTSTDNDQPLKIATGAVVTITAPEGQELDLFDVWLDAATIGDGVVVLYS